MSFLGEFAYLRTYLDRFLTLEILYQTSSLI